MNSKIINSSIVPYADGEFRIQYQGIDGECNEGFAGTLGDAIAHGIANADATDEVVSVWGQDTINGNVLDKVGAMAFRQ